LAGIDLLFLPVAAGFWIWYEKNIDNTLMFSAVAKKSRTFSSLPHSADEQVCRSWEGAQPGRQPSWLVEIFHTIDVMLSLRMGVCRGAGILFFPRVQIFSLNP